MTSESSMSLSDDSESFAGGLSDRLSHQYKERRRVLNLVDKLSSYGLQQSLDLPQIAVIGSQSVGKSSLIESISGITLPRAKGTCTRCPIECRLSRTNSPWSCKVFLRIASQVNEVPFGSPISDKSEVEDRIRRAQLAILNPSTDPLDFLGDSRVISENEFSFSSDVVSIRISGREMDDLSFVDLPGIIASVRDGGKESDIDEVKNLVMNIIKKPSCLILLVVSCETDIENQGARSLAKQVDESGNRTIPVLTKPDRIAKGEHSSWIEMLSNERERFRHGWHCVKQSDQEQLDQGISWKHARENELDFFETTPPWSSMEESIKSRLGTQFLTDASGRILFELICKRLPDLLAEVERRTKRIREGLEKLPTKPTGDPVETIFKMTEAFKQDVQLLVKGRPDAGRAGLIQNIRRSKEQFRDSIFRQAPEFKPFDRPAQPTRDNSSTQPFITPPRGVTEDAAEEDLEPRGPKDPETFVYLDEVLATARDSITRELPNHHPYAVNERYIKRFTANWPMPAHRLFESMKRQFLKELKVLVTHHFSAFATGGLEDAVMRTVIAQVESCSDRAKMKMNECIALEHEEPATVNEHYLADYKRKFHARYTAARRQHVKQKPTLQNFLDGGFQDTPVMQNAVHNLNQMGFESIKKNELLRLLPADKADDAIEIMSEVRAYYQVAFKRFADNIPMILDYELLKGFDRTLNQALFKSLAVAGGEANERSAEFLQEDPDIVRRRDILQQELQRFDAALSDLQNIPGVSLSWGSRSDEELSTGSD